MTCSEINYLQYIYRYRRFHNILKYSKEILEYSKLLQFCWFGHCTIQSTKKIKKLVFTKIIKSVKLVIAMHQST